MITVLQEGTLLPSVYTWNCQTLNFFYETGFFLYEGYGMINYTVSVVKINQNVLFEQLSAFVFNKIVHLPTQQNL